MKRPEEKTEDSEPKTIRPSESDSGRLPPTGGNRESILLGKNEMTAPVRTATGPRTPAGKQQSKYNATQHGIFSNVVVLKGESRGDYETLLDGLLSSLQPIGEPAEILVEKLAMLLWRHRRVVIARTRAIPDSASPDGPPLAPFSRQGSDLPYGRLGGVLEGGLTGVSGLGKPPIR